MSVMLEMARRRVLILGVDGGTWDILVPYMKDGVMPRLARIVDESSWGTLKSVIPPYTAPAWTTLVTGVNPGRHGCYGFMGMRSFGDFYPINSGDIKSETVYETLFNSGFKCSLINLPVSYPPRIPETVITSLLSRRDDIVHPKALVEEIEGLDSYRVMPEGINPAEKSEFPRDSDLIIENDAERFRVARQLFERDWDFFFLLFSGSDWIQHRAYWEMLEGGGPRSEGAKDYFRRLDEWLYWFFSRCEEDTLRIIVSDHGFKRIDKEFAINDWLEREGFLKTVRIDKMSDKHSEFVLEKDLDRKLEPETLKPTVTRIRDAVGKNRCTSRLVPVARKLFERSGRMRSTLQGTYRPDFKRSAAFCYYTGIFVNEELPEREELTEDIIDRLQRMNQEQRIFRAAARREDIYWGNQVGSAPRITLVDHAFIPRSTRGKVLAKEVRSSSHAKGGVIVMQGPAGMRGGNVRATLMDICPTVLDWMGLDGPLAYDGRSLLR